MTRTKLQSTFNAPHPHYRTPAYDTKKRFCSYWHQIREVLSSKPESTLEVGMGNGFVSNYLNSRANPVITLDVDPRLHPQVAGSVLAMPFGKRSFDVVLCCEVLEHLPYAEFRRSIQELYRVAKRRVILSVPDVTTVYRINIELPRMKPIKRLIPHPFPRPAKLPLDGEHYWEIGMAGYPLKRITSDIANVGFGIDVSYRVFENYYHRLFCLRKR